MPTVDRCESDEASPLLSSTTKKSIRSRQMRLYDRTHTVQAALPDLILKRLETDMDGAGTKPEKIISYEEASNFKQSQSNSKVLVSKIISYCRDESEKSAEGERVESDSEIKYVSERRGMISLQKWKKAMNSVKNTVDEQMEILP